MDAYKKIVITFSSALFFIALFTAYAETKEDNPYRFHELTIYVIPSPVELDWNSPATLYQTYRKSLLSAVLTGNPYSMGHLFIKLTTPLLEEPFFAGMSSVSRKEQKNWVYKEKAGLGVLGVGIRGIMEKGDKLNLVKKTNIKRNRLVAITYRLSDIAAERVLRFIEEFEKKNDAGHLPSGYYGGAFWPLYEQEGAGCTAFGMAMLELAGIKQSEIENWKHEVNIPMYLIGGELNPGNMVKIRDIKNAENWHNGAGEANSDFVKYSIYDPSLIFNWILEKLSGSEKKTSLEYFDATTYTTPRLFSDIRDIEVDSEIPIFRPRYDENLFIYHFLKSNRLLEEHVKLHNK
jgi:hypothetical protein